MHGTVDRLKFGHIKKKKKKKKKKNILLFFFFNPGVNAVKLCEGLHSEDTVASCFPAL